MAHDSGGLAGKAGAVEQAEEHVRRNQNPQAMENLMHVVQGVSRQEASDIFRKVSSFDASNHNRTLLELDRDGSLTVKGDIYKSFKDPAEDF
jgi:thermostable 8-oxoguanine DNA glycosylase